MNKGFIAISTVLILLVVVVSIVTTVSLLSVGEARSGFALAQGEAALQFSEGCAEDALLKAKSDTTYAGGNIVRPEGTCVIDIAKNGISWTLDASPLNGDSIRHVRVVFDYVPLVGIILTSWTEM